MGGEKVNPETSRVSLRRGDKEANFAMDKFSKFNKKDAGTKNLIKSIAYIALYLVTMYLFFSVYCDPGETTGGIDEYDCSTNLGNISDDTTICSCYNNTTYMTDHTTLGDVAAKCSPEAGWKRWDFWDTAYFVMVTITTVGYGDMGPVSDDAKWFMIFFLPVGILVVAGALGVMISFFLEKMKERKKKKEKDMEDVAKKVGNAMAMTPAAVNKKSGTLADDGPTADKPEDKQTGLKKQLQHIIAGAGLPAEQIVMLLKELADERSTDATSLEVSNSVRPHPTPQAKATASGDVSNKPGALPPLATANDRTSGKMTLVPLSTAPQKQPAVIAAAKGGGGSSAAKVEPELETGGDAAARSMTLSEASKPPPVDTADGGSGQPPAAGDVSTVHKDGFQGVQSPVTPATPMVALWRDPEVRKELKRKVALGWALFKCFTMVWIFVVFAFILGYIEKWTLLDSLYYAIVTVTTVGYGDKSPATKGGRIFAIFLVPFGVVGFSQGFGSVMSVLENEKQGASETLMDKVIELERIIADDDDGTVTLEEFTINQLKKVYHVDDETLSSIKAQFTNLDADGSGELDQDDIIQLKATCRQLGIKATQKESPLFRRLSTIALGEDSTSSKTNSSKRSKGIKKSPVVGGP